MPVQSKLKTKKKASQNESMHSKEAHGKRVPSNSTPQTLYTWWLQTFEPLNAILFSKPLPGALGGARQGLSTRFYSKEALPAERNKKFMKFSNSWLAEIVWSTDTYEFWLK